MNFLFLLQSRYQCSQIQNQITPSSRWTFCFYFSLAINAVRFRIKSLLVLDELFVSTSVSLSMQSDSESNHSLFYMNFLFLLQSRYQCSQIQNQITPSSRWTFCFYFSLDINAVRFRIKSLLVLDELFVSTSVSVSMQSDSESNHS